MKKVLLVTIEDNDNLGNRLQHYALKHTIESLGCSVDSLMVKTAVSPTMIFMKNTIKNLLVHIGFNKYQDSLSRGKRTAKILNFNKRYISNIVRIQPEELFRSDWANYDLAITGSDQVWHNWHSPLIPEELSYYYLEFIDKSKRVSYAPSFGFTEFPEEDLSIHKRGLSNMKTLSCREKEGCDLIQNLTGLSATKTLDPTLLLTKQDWGSIEKKPKFSLPKQYLLQFFLGKVDPEYQAEILSIAKSHGLQIIDIRNVKDQKHYGISPNEFLWLIHNADTVCTDSFHASVFSICFERNLRVFKRKAANFENMFGRLEDLLKPLDKLNLVYGIGNDISTDLSNEARQKMILERNASMDYLKNAISN